MPRTAFKWCPKCGKEAINYDDFKRLNCSECGWTYFHNTAVAVAGILSLNGDIVFLIRGHEPSKGMLDMPGGFVDPGESAEQALLREIKEELGVELSKLKYLFSYPNKYEYQGVSYNTCDLFYAIQLDHSNFTIDHNEVKGYEIINPKELDFDRLAFDSMKKGIAAYAKMKKAD